MNKQAIQNTAIVFWSDEDECFVVQSPLLDSVIGAGDSIDEATREFSDILSDAYEAYLEGRVSAEKPGRPSKNKTALNTDVKPETRAGIRGLATELTCSQGEVIDYLHAFYHHRVNVKINFTKERSASALQILTDSKISAGTVSDSIGSYSSQGNVHEPTETGADTDAGWAVRAVKLIAAANELDRLEIEGWQIFSTHISSMDTAGLQMIIVARKTRRHSN